MDYCKPVYPDCGGEIPQNAKISCAANVKGGELNNHLGELEAFGEQESHFCPPVFCPIGIQQKWSDKNSPA